MPLLRVCNYRRLGKDVSTNARVAHIECVLLSAMHYECTYRMPHSNAKQRGFWRYSSRNTNVYQSSAHIQAWSCTHNQASRQVQSIMREAPQPVKHESAKHIRRTLVYILKNLYLIFHIHQRTVFIFSKQRRFPFGYARQISQLCFKCN